MSTIAAQQEDGPAPCGWIFVGGMEFWVACTGVKGLGPLWGHALAAVGGGTPGTGDKNLRLGSGQSLIALIWEISPGPADWLAGNYRIKINVTGPPGYTALTWRSTWVCRVNASCTSVATVGLNVNHYTAISNLNPTVYTIDVAGAAQPSAADDDRLYICAHWENLAKYYEYWTIVSDQIITTPLIAAAGATDLVDGGILPPQLVGGILVG